MSFAFKGFDLTGKHALVTGSSRGLGLAMARGLAQAGAHVTLNGRQQESVDAAVAALQAEGLSADGAVCDITVSAALEQVIAELDPIDILVNNAGIQIRAPFVEHTDATWHTMFDTHVMGAVVPSRAVVPGMVARGGGKIINICSLMSEKGRTSVVPYTVMKGALKMLTRALATELGSSNIQVNGIGPGYFDTEMNKALIENTEFDAFVRGRTPLGRWAQAEELAGAAVFLASPAANFVTGQIVYVDGGILAAL